MSVLIKGMEMSKNCDECPLLTEDGDYDVCFVGKRRVMWEWKYDRGSEVIHPKPDWCPIIEVPPHGRLIDADVLKACWKDTFFEEMVQILIQTVPTVISADKDGET